MLNWRSSLEVRKGSISYYQAVSSFSEDAKSIQEKKFSAVQMVFVHLPQVLQLKYINYGKKGALTIFEAMHGYMMREFCIHIHLMWIQISRQCLQCKYWDYLCLQRGVDTIHNSDTDTQIHTHHHSSSELIKVTFQPNFSTKNFVSERCKDFMCRTVTDKGIRQSGLGVSEDTCQDILSVIPHLSQKMNAASQTFEFLPYLYVMRICATDCVLHSFSRA